MKLLTKEIERLLEKQGDTSPLPAENIQVICKWFNPTGAGTWYIYERDKDNPDIFWAFVDLGDPVCAECGTVSLSELQALKLPWGLKIERDTHFKPCPLQQIIDKVKGY